MNDQQYLEYKQQQTNTIKQLRVFRLRLAEELKTADRAMTKIKNCVKIINEACEKNNGLPF